ncbi:MAG: exosortase Q [Ramlibacter sp.]|nr:exosortase Q [Ramlibacter sp.]MBX3659791.1 exosortase Q [Ramlibacter sp.]MCW5651146.1 exosortase Q [Ramlibacter sp.]
MNTRTLIHTPGFVRWGIRIDVAPAWVWLAAQMVALWPTWLWTARRMVDRSDDPLGLLALAALATLGWQARHELRAAPRLAWLAAGMAGTLAATLCLGRLPPLAAGLVSVLALACTLLAFLPYRIARLPVAGLAVLALPLLSSLQFYLGYPLRLVTAEASRWLLSVGATATREGAGLLVNGQRVLVDAPCSGVQMAWLGYFTACTVALWAGLSDRILSRRLPWVGLLVLGGNVLRNTVLVALQTSGSAPGPVLHELLGLAFLASTCSAIAWLMSRPSEGGTP